MFMRNPRHTGACAALLFVLAGCDGAPAQQEAAPSPAPTTPAPETSPVAQDAVPAAMHGRWGMVPADCEPGRADAKGLMVVSADRLEFYESVARLADVDNVTATRIAATFAFTGEGMEWSRSMVLELEDDGAALIRTQTGGEEPMQGPLRYDRCPA